jgi:hypothetical protein
MVRLLLVFEFEVAETPVEAVSRVGLVLMADARLEASADWVA